MKMFLYRWAMTIIYIVILERMHQSGLLALQDKMRLRWYQHFGGP